ncbi:hypothetical protein Q7P37_007116 [Cladosporium fusiforme]
MSADMNQTPSTEWDESGLHLLSNSNMLYQPVNTYTPAYGQPQTQPQHHEEEVADQGHIGTSTESAANMFQTHHDLLQQHNYYSPSQNIIDMRAHGQQQLPQHGTQARYPSLRGQYGQAADGVFGDSDNIPVDPNLSNFEDTPTASTTATSARPVSSPAPGPAPSMGQVWQQPQYGHASSSPINAGFRFYHSKRRTLDIKNDDYDNLRNENAAYVRLVHKAIVHAPDSTETSHMQLTKKIQALGSDGSRYLSAISSMIVAAIIALHAEGDYLFASQFQSLKPRKEDKTMTATQRVHCICQILSSSKKHITDIVDGGHDAVVRFVAAPAGADYLKKRYKGNNDARATKAKGLQQQHSSSDVATQLALNAGHDNSSDEEDDIGSLTQHGYPAGPRTNASQLMFNGNTDEISGEHDLPCGFSSGMMSNDPAGTGEAPSRKRRRAT